MTTWTVFLPTPFMKLYFLFFCVCQISIDFLYCDCLSNIQLLYMYMYFKGSLTFVHVHWMRRLNGFDNFWNNQPRTIRLSTHCLWFLCANLWLELCCTKRQIKYSTVYVVYMYVYKGWYWYHWQSPNLSEL